MKGTKAGAIESSEQLSTVWKSLIEDVGATALSSSGVNHLWADSAFPFYNTLSLADTVVDGADLRVRLSHAAAHMRDATRLGFLWIFEELLTGSARAELDRSMRRAGLVRAMTCFGMAGNVLPLPDPLHPELRFQRVSTQEQLGVYADLNARAYGMTQTDVRSVFTRSRLWLNRIHAYIGYEEDRPVCCAGTIPADGRLFVVLVATEADRRRRGYGEAVTRKALHEGAKVTGLRRATLHALSAGRPVYERIGLAVTSILGLYGLPRREEHDHADV